MIYDQSHTEKTKRTFTNGVRVIVMLLCWGWKQKLCGFSRVTHKRMDMTHARATPPVRTVTLQRRGALQIVWAFSLMNDTEFGVLCLSAEIRETSWIKKVVEVHLKRACLFG